MAANLTDVSQMLNSNLGTLSQIFKTYEWTSELREYPGLSNVQVMKDSVTESYNIDMQVDISVVIYLADHDLHVKLYGYYTSHGGLEFDDDWMFVLPKQVMTTVYEQIEFKHVDL